MDGERDTPYSIFCDALKQRKGVLGQNCLLTVAPMLPPTPHATPVHPGLLLSQKFEHLRVLDQARVRCSLIPLKVYAATPSESQ